MNIKTPYFLHLLRFLFFIACAFGSVVMFYKGFSPFKFILPSKTRSKSICDTDGGSDFGCKEADFDKLVLVVIDGWNNKMAEYLDYPNITQMFPAITEKFSEENLKNPVGTSLFMNVELDERTSPSAIAKTMLVGNIPGLIEIPKQMYFNTSSQVMYTNDLKSSAAINLDEDNLLYRNIRAQKGLSMAVGKPIVQKSLRELFNDTLPIRAAFTLDQFVNENLDMSQFGEEGNTKNSEISILMVNHKVDVGKSKDFIKLELENINRNLERIMKKLDEDTVLVVTGNKAFQNNTFNKFANHLKIPKKSGDVTDQSSNVEEEVSEVAGQRGIYSGLFTYSKRQSKAKYNYNDAAGVAEDLLYRCPDPSNMNKILGNKHAEVTDKYGSMVPPGKGSNPLLMAFFNTFEASPTLTKPETTHILNITSTLASFLGLSNPYSNIGSIIPHSYLFMDHSYCTTFYKSLVLRYYNNLKQVLEYNEQYYHGHKLSQHLLPSHTSDDVEGSSNEEIMKQILDDVEEVFKDYERNLQIEIDLNQHLQVKQSQSDGRRLDGNDTTQVESDSGKKEHDESKAKDIIDTINKAQDQETLSAAKSDNSTSNEESHKPSANDINSLNFYLLNCGKTLDKIFTHLNVISQGIKEDQVGINTTRFELAILTLLLLMAVLAIRVLAFIFDNEQSYKRLPTTAKVEREEDERQTHKHRNLFVASNPQLVLFSVITFLAFAFVFYYPFISCCIFTLVCTYKILEQLVVVVKQSGNIKKNVNLKRKTISIACFIIGCGYVFSQYDRDFVQSFDTKLTFAISMLYLIVLCLNIYDQRLAFCSIKNILTAIICIAIIKFNDIMKYDHWYMPLVLQRLMTSAVINYTSLIGVTFLSYYMIRVMRRFGPTTRPTLVKIYALKNLISFVCIVLYWLGQQGLLIDWIPTQVICAETIYISTIVIFVIQVIGLFNPNITSLVDPKTEKEHPLKRIKENLFFMLFNMLHVFILIGGPKVAPQYLLMYTQILTFFDLCSGVRIYNSLVSSLFTVLTALQYFLATGHGFEASTLQSHQANSGLNFIDKRLVLFFIYFNAYAPVIFCVSWSLQMVIKQQDNDSKMANIILDLSKDEENSTKDVIVLRKKLSLNMVHEFCLRCLFFLYAGYMSSMLLTAKVLIAHTGEKEYVTNKFFFDTLFVLVSSGTSLLVIFFSSFA